jgi:hypothetical protein
MDKRKKASEDQAQKHKHQVLKALAASWSIGKLIEAWRASAPSSLWTPAVAADWVRMNVTFDSGPLNDVLGQIMADGTVLGSDLADYAFVAGGGSDPSISLTSSFDWSNWTPGNRAEALIANPTGSFADRLAERGVTIQGINDTTADRIGRILSDGLADGLSPHVVASDIAGELIDSRTNWAATLEERLADDQKAMSRAETIARTEMNQATVDETMNRYAELGVEQVQWEVVDPCDICGPLDGEIRGLGDEFDDGITGPLVHPNCNCRLVAYFGENATGDEVSTEDLGDGGDIEMSAQSDKGIRPELKLTPQIGIPSSLEVARAISRLQILPNPNNPEIGNPEKFVEPPWSIEPVPTIDPNIWDTAVIKLVDCADLFSTDPYLKRKNVKRHIESMGQSLLPFRSYAMVLEHEGKPLIIDGHHRLMALWLLGLSQAPVWYVKE